MPVTPKSHLKCCLGNRFNLVYIVVCKTFSENGLFVCYKSKPWKKSMLKLKKHVRIITTFTTEVRGRARLICVCKGTTQNSYPYRE